jgi:hypothetical protein
VVKSKTQVQEAFITTEIRIFLEYQIKPKDMEVPLLIVSMECYYCDGAWFSSKRKLSFMKQIN